MTQAVPVVRQQGAVQLAPAEEVRGLLHSHELAAWQAIWEAVWLTELLNTRQ